MESNTSDEPANASVCDRCGDSLAPDHWIRLTASHQGVGSNRYLDADRRICVDCVAALGMLEFSPASAEDARESESGLRDRFPTVQSRLR